MTHNVPLVFQTPYSRIVQHIIEPEALGGGGAQASESLALRIQLLIIITF